MNERVAKRLHDALIAVTVIKKCTPVGLGHQGGSQEKHSQPGLSF